MPGSPEIPIYLKWVTTWASGFFINSTAFEIFRLRSSGQLEFVVESKLGRMESDKFPGLWRADVAPISAQSPLSFLKRASLATL